MSEQNKKVLLVGLGSTIDKDPDVVRKFGDSESIHKAIQIGLEEAKEAGYECTVLSIEMDDWEASLKTVREKLQSQNWDGFTIGAGFRTLNQYVDEFEDLVNLWSDVAPSIKLGFSTGPEEILKTMQRMFPEGK